MRLRTLYCRSLGFHWRTNLATTLGVAAAASVLIGALLVGDSMRGSLRDLAAGRLGRVDHALVAGRFLRTSLASQIAADRRLQSRFGPICPVILMRGLAHHAGSGARANRIHVLGVDDRFWLLGQSHPVVEMLPASGRSILLNQPLARELGASPGDDVLVRLERRGDVPSETLFGRPDEAFLSLRLTVRGVISAEGLGGFGLRPTQVQPFNAYIPLATLQRALKRRGRCNAILVAGRLEDDASGPADTDRLQDALDERIELEDLGLRLRRDDAGACIVLESAGFLLEPTVEEAAIATAQSVGAPYAPVLSYLANSMTVVSPRPPPSQPGQTTTPVAATAATATAETAAAGARRIPYSTVAAVDGVPDLATTSLTLTDGTAAPRLKDREILLNDWAARDLRARPGDRIRLTYYLEGQFGRLRTQSATLVLRGVVRMRGLAADRSLIPEYEGMTDAENVADWRPPFPIDLRMIRQKDERYWDDHGPTPKAFVSLKTGQALWAHRQDRFGRLTSIRIGPAQGKDLSMTADTFERALLRRLTGRRMGLAFEPVKARALAASGGSTDFAMLFLGFSFFLIASAAMLVGLMFRLGVERRSSEIGLLLAVGFSPRSVARLLLAEGALLAGVGSAIGLTGAMGYAWLMLAGLRSWWSEAVSAPFLQLHVHGTSVLIGLVASLTVGLLSIAWSVRGMARLSPWSLLVGATPSAAGVAPTKRPRVPAVLAFGAMTVAVILVGLAAGTDLVPEASAFFSSGAAMLFAGLAALTTWTRHPRRVTIAGGGAAAIARLGVRNATRYPRRSLLTAGLIACATFILVVVAASRHEMGPEAHAKHAGTGGFVLMAESAVPLLHDLNTVDGRKNLSLSQSSMDALGLARVMPFRLRAGDEASCLNLYRPDRPRLLGAPDAMIGRGGFRFASSLARTEQEKRNPWMLLARELPDGAVPAIGDYNAVMWLLHLGLGEDLAMTDDHGRPIRLRIVGMLSGSVLQGELVIAESRFVVLFPSVSGYNFFLIDAPVVAADRVRRTLEADLGNYGFDVVATADRLRAYHAVENAYLAAFQTLGGLGMVLGTLGLAAVLLRNVFERRGELALMRSLGYRRSSLGTMVLAENSAMLLAGLAIGMVAALLAVAPHALSRPSAIPWPSLGLTLAAALLTGTVAGVVAMISTLRSPLLPALRSE